MHARPVQVLRDLGMTVVSFELGQSYISGAGIIDIFIRASNYLIADRRWRSPFEGRTLRN